MKRIAVSGAVALMLASAGNGAPADLKVSGSVTAQTDAATVANCRLTKSGTTLLHYGVRLNTGKATGLGSKSVSVVFEVVPYNGLGTYNAAEQQFGDTPVEATLQTQGIVGIDEKWLATSGVLAVTNRSGQTLSGTVDADLAPTKKKAGAIHLSGTWSCTIDK
ncbi:MAG TPA: hypothetical protein VF219_05485 [Vicinamibacterales bacterium]